MSTGDLGEFTDLVLAKIENLRPKLLDLSRRNPLVSTRLSSRTNAYIRVVDELPDALFFCVVNQEALRFVPLPSLETDPKDEDSQEFQAALSNAHLSDDEYMGAMDAVDPNDENSFEITRAIERDLRDRLRSELGLAPRQKKDDISLTQHARNNGISPSWELPQADDEHEDGRHSDSDIQTLLLPEALERSLNGLLTKCRTWEQETGINVLHAAFGYLEWDDGQERNHCISPLILAPVKIAKRKTPDGPEFWVEGTGEQGELNTVLAEKLRLEFGIALPEYDGGSIEEYLVAIAELKPPKMRWRVRRYVVYGVFPSARMAMYYDLNTTRANFESNEIVGKLLGGIAADSTAVPFADEFEVDQPEVESKVPLLVADADSSQFSALVDVADGRNIAVEGPPGTGKSQTIVNIIATAIASGKKVLFVAEKLAALDVVRSRLNAMELGEFVLPLQANRSTRDEVIRSIKERIEMPGYPTPKNYESRIAQFKNTRTELSQYVQTIASTFKQTGLTIHEILGKNIATREKLAKIPREVQTLDIAEIEQFDEQKRNYLLGVAAHISRTYISSNKAKPDWRAIQRSPLDPFTAEQILNSAEEAAIAYSEIPVFKREVQKFGINSKLNSPTLIATDSLIKSLAEFGKDIDCNLVRALHSDSIAAELESFLAECEKCRVRREKLADIVKNPDDSALVNTLVKIGEICADGKLPTLAIPALRQILEQRTKRIANAEKAKSGLGEFLQEVPLLAEYPISTLCAAGKFIRGLDREILSFRNEVNSDPHRISHGRRIVSAGRTLASRCAELNEQFIIAEPSTPEGLREAAAILRSRHLLSVLFPKYRTAKAKFRSICRSSQYDPLNAADGLEAIAKWKSDAADFERDDQARAIFGFYFKGIDTDFDSFDRLFDYFDTVESEFPGIQNRDIRQFLRVGEQELLLSLPDFDTGDKSAKFKNLDDSISRQKVAIDRFAASCRILDPLVECFIKPENIDVEVLPRLCKATASYQEAHKTVKNSNQISDLIGDRFLGTETTRQSIQNEISIANLTRNHVDSEALINLLEDNRIEDCRNAVGNLIMRLQETESVVQRLADLTRIEMATLLDKEDYADLPDKFRSMSEDKEGLVAHSNLNAALRQLAGTDFESLVSSLHNSKYGFLDFPEILEAILIRALAIQVYREHGDILSRFSGVHLDQLRKTLAALDREIIKSSRRFLRAAANRAASPPAGNGVGRKSTWTEMSLINNEINKKRGYYPVRDMTQRAGSALLELKPCWMMSPLAIAQYLKPNGIKFDLCIIDEASQMPPENAIGALLRSEQAVIVGDTNQLPPTSFFRKFIEDEDADEDETILDESILEMASAAFRPMRRLRWHYRSRHSGLINFSNRMVYDDDLIVFPSASETRADMGVHFRSIEGTYKSGLNAIEAREIVKEVIAFMRSDPNRSLGVVTLNQKQRDLIIEELEFALGRDAAATKYVERWAEEKEGLESFFVKNLENVQGDERDVIFIGTVYGPETIGGKVMQRFGPINGIAGKRRLNVLFSRAKQKIVTFSSMNSGDISADEMSNPGVFMLKRWLEYSVTGRIEAGVHTAKEPDSDFEEFVIKQIEAMGCTAVPQVGVAGYFVDIGVKHPKWPHGFLLGVECDGASYHSSKSARERDRLRQEVLEGLGWKFHRIWSTDWFNDPNLEAEKLRRRIEERLSEESDKLQSTKKVANSESEQIAGDFFEDSNTVRDMFPEIYDDAHVAEPSGQYERTEETVDRHQVETGDTVKVRYLDGKEETVQVTLSEEKNDPEQGVIHVSRPIARALLGAEEEDEIEVLIGNRLRLAVVENVHKH